MLNRLRTADWDRILAPAVLIKLQVITGEGIPVALHVRVALFIPSKIINDAGETETLGRSEKKVNFKISIVKLIYQSKYSYM